MATRDQAAAGSSRWAGTSVRPGPAFTPYRSTYPAASQPAVQAGLAGNSQFVASPASGSGSNAAQNSALGSMRTANPVPVSSDPFPPAVDPPPAPAAASANWSATPGFFADWDAGLGTEHLHGKVGHPLGGIPTAHDFLPSLMFILLYTLLLGPVIMRLKAGMLTFGQLWRPLMAILLNIATYGVRIKLAEGHTWNKDTFIAEIVLMRLTPILLTSALVALFRHAVQPYLPHRDSPNLAVTLSLRHFVGILQLATYFCLGLTLAIAFDVKQAINGSPEAHTKLHRSKEVCIYLLLVINISVWTLSTLPLVLLKTGKYSHELVVTRTREAAKFMAIVSVCTFLLIVTSFKAAQLASAGKNNKTELVTNEKSVFYCVCVTAEFIACALLVCLSWARLVPPRELLEMHCRLRKEAMQQRELHGHPSIGWPTPPGQMTHSDAAAQQMRRAQDTATIYGRDAVDVMNDKGGMTQGATFSPSGQPHGGTGQNDNTHRHSGVLTNDPFRIDDCEGNTTLTRRDSMATLSTISEVRESSPSDPHTPPRKFLQWARALSSSPKKWQARVDTAPSRRNTLSPSPESYSGNIFDRRGSNDSSTGSLKPPLYLPNASPQASTSLPGLTSGAPRAIGRGRSSSAGSSSMAAASTSHTLLPADFRSGGSIAASHPLRAAHHPAVLIAPLERQPSSACSIRSHWSDDSEEETPERRRGSFSLSRKKG